MEQSSNQRFEDNTIPSLPDELYHFPEKNGGIENLGITISVQQITFVQENLLQFDEDENIMHEYLSIFFISAIFNNQASGKRQKNCTFTS